MQQTQLPIECEEKRVYREIETKLSQAEAAEFGIEVGRLAGTIEKAKKEAKESENKQDELISILKKNQIKKNVECTLKLFYNTRVVQVWNGDEMLEERAMTDSEFQMEFPEVKHGVVEEDDSDETEDFGEDITETMRAEKSKNKPSLVDMR